MTYQRENVLTRIAQMTFDLTTVHPDSQEFEGYLGYVGYIAVVGPTIAAHGGEILVAGEGSEAVEGALLSQRFERNSVATDWRYRL